MEQLIDVRLLEPPEPLERILDALADLSPGDWLRVQHRRDPLPLYGMLQQMGYRWDTTHPAPGQLEILIWPEHQSSPDASAEDG